MKTMPVYLWIILVCAILIAIGAAVGLDAQYATAVRWIMFGLSVLQIALAGAGLMALRSHGGMSLTGTK